MRWRLHTGALAAVLAVVPIAPVHTSRPVAVAGCRGTGPIAVVRAYYAAAARHDARGAQACLTMTFRYLTARAVDSDWVNIASIHLTRVRAYPVSPSDAPGDILERPARLVQVVVEYVVRWLRITGSLNGPGIRFIYVEKGCATSPWLIGSIGSGP